MDRNRLQPALVEVRLPCGVVSVRREFNGRHWLDVEGAMRPALRLREEADPQFTLCGAPPTHGILAGLAHEEHVSLEMPGSERQDAVHGEGAWLLVVARERISTAIEDGTLVTTGRDGEHRRPISSLQPFAVG